MASFGLANFSQTNIFVSFNLKDVVLYLKSKKEDIEIIFLIGESGSGKTLFFDLFKEYINNNKLPTKYKDKLINKDGLSQTKKCTFFTFKHNEKQILMIDTPGIGDTDGFFKDEENLEEIYKKLSSLKVELGERIYINKFLFFVNDSIERHHILRKYIFPSYQILMTKNPECIVIATHNIDTSKFQLYNFETYSIENLFALLKMKEEWKSIKKSPRYDLQMARITSSIKISEQQFLEIYNIITHTNKMGNIDVVLNCYGKYKELKTVIIILQEQIDDIVGLISIAHSYLKNDFNLIHHPLLNIKSYLVNPGYNGPILPCCGVCYLSNCNCPVSKIILKNTKIVLEFMIRQHKYYSEFKLNELNLEKLNNQFVEMKIRVSEIKKSYEQQNLKDIVNYIQTNTLIINFHHHINNRIAYFKDILKKLNLEHDFKNCNKLMSESQTLESILNILYNNAIDELHNCCENIYERIKNKK